MPTKKVNHLEHESSPYLKQHVYNPVDWYPWGEEAFTKAIAENKPILLSLGYAACHWCHVMAHESFEDEATAAVMNELFVNIKVDREERPDLDKIYQTTHYMLTKQHGGWPLTVFLTPDDRVPFFSGTYFPLEPKYQLPAFKQVLTDIHAFYREHHEAVRSQNKELMNILQHQYPPAISQNIHMDMQPIQHAFNVLQERYDAVNGGFGSAPKFPHPTILAFLLKLQPDIVTSTLEKMANGGIYDQLAGGFFRYTVDAAWEIPHFEKMLYDNAQLLILYSLATQQSDADFNSVISKTAEWIINVMQSPDGGYFSSMDADSEGVEGKYYSWQKDDIQKQLTAEEFAVVAFYFNLNKPANFEHHWHLHITHSIEETAQALKLSTDETMNLLVSAQQKLLMIRTARTAPAIDKKILTAWNALMIKGMLLAGKTLNNSTYINSAKQALQFIHQHLWINKRLYAVYNENQYRIPAFLDDYAFLLDAVLTAHETAQEPWHLAFAEELANALLEHFEDKENGGFFFTANDAETLLYRSKTMMDEVIPSGNAIAAAALLTLSKMTNNKEYLKAAEKTLQFVWPMLLKFPSEHCGLLMVLDNFLNKNSLRQ